MFVSVHAKIPNNAPLSFNLTSIPKREKQGVRRQRGENCVERRGVTQRGYTLRGAWTRVREKEAGGRGKLNTRGAEIQ